MKNPISKSSVLNGADKVFSVLHAVAMLVPEAVVTVEVSVVKALTKKGEYTADEIMDARYRKTGEIHRKASELPMALYRKAKTFVKADKEERVIVPNVVYGPQNQSA